MDSKADQPLLEASRTASYMIGETKGYDYIEPKEEVEHIELRDTEPAVTGTDGGQGETIQVTATETTVTETKKGKKTKMPKCQTECKPNALTIGLNVYDRDEKNINGQVHIMFDDVMAEPDGAHSFEPFWRGTYISFYYTKLWVYRFLAAFVGMPLAFIWGLLFALVTAFNNYLFTPFFKLFALFFFMTGRLWGTMFRAFMDPIFESVGRCFSGIRFSRGEYCTVGTNTHGKTTQNPTGASMDPCFQSA